MPDLARELQHAWRRLRRAPGFTSTSVFVLALGLGAATAMFGILYGVVLRPLPFPSPDQLVTVTHSISVAGISRVDESGGTYLLYQRHNSVFSKIGAWQETSVNLGPVVGRAGNDDAQRIGAAAITASLFPTLGVSPERGHSFTTEEDRPGAPRVIILSYALWRQKYGGDPSIVGKHIVIDGVPCEVVGIMPASFRYPWASTQLWYPVQFDPANSDPLSFNFTAVARLKPGATTETARADLARFTPRLLDEFPFPIPKAMFEKAHLTPVVRPLRDVMVGDVSRLLWVLFGAVGLVLLIACANVANLFLVRAEGRHRELAVRNALGASRGALLVQYLSESALIAAGGGVLGLAMSWSAIRLVPTLPSGIDVPRANEVRLDLAVWAFAAAATLLCALAVSLVPLLRTRRIPISTVLRDSGRSATAGAERHRTRSTLVIAQVALALVLVAASGLMARSFNRLRTVDPGFDPTRAVSLQISLPTAKYQSTNARAAFFTELASRVRALPGVEKVGIGTTLPLSGDQNTSALFVEDYSRDPNALPGVHVMLWSTRDYFSSIGIRVLSGRMFSEGDVAHPALELVVSRAFAERYWKGASALGKRVRRDAGSPWYTIVGVVNDVHMEGLELPAEQTVYFPLIEADGDTAAGVPRNVVVTVRAAGDPGSVIASVRQVVHALDPLLPTHHERTISALLASATARVRFLMVMLGAASGIALVLGAVGLYGVMAYGVSLRQREIGVRMALGARPADVSRMISRQGLVLGAVGVAIGLASALGVTRLLRGMLYDVSPTDPLTLASTCIALLAVALIASWLPARRAAGVDPAVALRSD
ncbi:MAG TPA: ABC transporter permease [Gemmatimonadaceae bacterium]|nr:ABC transporter permease [Gemmatimonadaceae bacterium]